MTRKTLVTLCLLCSFPAGAWADDPPGLQFERGWPVAGGCLRAAAGFAVEVGLGDAPSPWDEEHPPRIELQPNDQGGWTLAYRGRGGHLLDVYWPDPELPGGWLREIVYRNTSQQSQDFTELRLRVHVDHHPSARRWNPEFLRMAETRGGSILGAAFWTRADWYRLAEPDPGGLIEVEVHPGWRLEPGQEATVGMMGFWFAPSGPDAMRVAARRWFEARGCRPQVYPDALRRGILYEVSAGGHVDTNFSSLGGFEALARNMSMLGSLGVTALWLNAVAEHGGGNHYGVLDLETIDARLGGAEALTRLVQAARDHELFLMGEVVPHGFRSKQAAALPQWWTRRRDGTLAGNWGGYGMDITAPPWVDALARHAGWLARDFGFAGLRIDIAHGQGYNWGSPRTHHAGDSSIGGSLRMMEALGEAIAKHVEPRPVLLPEAPTLPEHFTLNSASLLGYGHGLTNLIERELPEHMEAPQAMVRLLRHQLETERGSLPPGALELRTLNNHDTVVRSGRPVTRFGVGLSRALYGVCLVAPGVPMLYQQEEIGSYHAFRRLHAARAALPALSRSRAVYPQPDYFDPRVFSALRIGQGQAVLCLVNLSGARVAGSARLPEVVAGQGASLRDAVSGGLANIDTHNRFDWELAPYAVAMLELRAEVIEAPVPMRAPRESRGNNADQAAFSLTPEGPELRHGEITLTLHGLGGQWRGIPGGATWQSPHGSGHMRATHEADGLTLSLGLDMTTTRTRPTLRIDGAVEWGVSGRTALLHDPVIRRRWPFASSTGPQWQRDVVEGTLPRGALYDGVAPVGRLWQSILEPLHPELPALAFADAGGAGLMVTIVHSGAGNIVLTDTSDETPLGPYPLEVRFLRDDTDLAPVIRKQLVRPGEKMGPWGIELRIMATTYPIETLLQAERRPFRPLIIIERQNAAW